MSAMEKDKQPPGEAGKHGILGNVPPPGPAQPQSTPEGLVAQSSYSAPRLPVGSTQL